MKPRQLAALDAKRWGKVLCVAWLMGLLCLPAILLAIGKRQPLLENKPKAPLTKFTLSGLTDPKTFTNLETNALEANPLRKDALDLRARAYVNVLGAPTTTLVSLGEDGFLFTRGELADCDDAAKTREAMVSLGLISEALRTAGAHTVVFVTGSKALAERRHKPRVFASELRCEAKHERQIDAALPRIPGGLLVAPAIQAQIDAGRDVFSKDDSHWNGYGRAAATRLVMHNLLPARNRPAIRVGSSAVRRGDIARFAGFARNETFVGDSAAMPPGHRPLKSGVVYIGDSQLQLTFFSGPLGPGFVATPGAQACSWLVPDAWGGGTKECQSAISKARYAVIETVSHHLERIIFSCALPVRAAVSSLKGQPVTLSGQRAAITDANGQATDVAVAGVPDVSSVDRVIRISTPKPEPVGLGQLAIRGPAASCATLTTATGQLVLVVRAGDRLSDLRLGLTAPAGSTFTGNIVDLKGAIRGL